MNVIRHIDELKNSRGWNDSDLSARAGLPRSTIANFRRRETVPSIGTLAAICDAFGITLSQFFNEDSQAIFVKAKDRDFVYSWMALSDTQKNMINGIVQEMR